MEKEDSKTTTRVVSLEVMDLEEENAVLDQEDSLFKRSHKCPGCKCPHEEHSWGDPGPYCMGPPDHLLDPSSDLKSEKHEMVENVDEEQSLAEQLKKLKLEEERLAKDTHIRNLKQAITAQKQKLAALQTHSAGSSLPTAAKPGKTSTSNSTVLTTAESTELTLRLWDRFFLLACHYMKDLLLLYAHRWMCFL